MSCFDVHILEPNNNLIEIETCIGDQPSSINIITQENTRSVEISHCVALLPSDFSELITVKNIIPGSGILVENASGIYTISLSNPIINSSNIVDLLETVQDIIGTSGLIGSDHIILDYDDSTGLTTISITGLQPSGDYANIEHTHSSWHITNFDNAVSGLLPSIQGTGYIYSIFDNNNNQYIIGSSGLQPSGDYSLINHTHTSNHITNFDNAVSGLLPDIIGSGYVTTSVLNNAYIISVSGLQSSGDYSIIGHNHNSIDITDFSLAVSGLLPNSYDAAVPWTINHTLVDGTRYLANDLVYENGRLYKANYENESIPVSNALYWTDVGPGYRLNIDGRDIPNIPYPVTNLAAGSGILITSVGTEYTINTIGLQSSGDYSLNGHSHSITDITDFNSGVSGLLPTIANSGNNRILTSTGSSVGINAENNLTFDGTTLGISGILSIDNLQFDNYTISSPSDSRIIIDGGNQGVQISGNAVPTLHLYGNTNGSVIFLDQDFSNVIDRTNNIISITADNGNGVIGFYANELTFNQIPISINGHTHSSSEITNFDASVSGLLTPYALLNSPNFSGIPTVPTASSGTNTTQIASTAFVRTEISNLVDSSPSTLDTLNELASALGDDPNFATTVTNLIGGKVSKSGDTMTGTLYAPTGIFSSGLTLNGVSVSVSGHIHTSSDISDFNNSVSGLLPVKNVSGSGYIVVSSSSGNYIVSATGLQPSGNYADLIHSHGYISSSGTINQILDNTNALIGCYFLGTDPFDGDKIVAYRSTLSHGLFDGFNNEMVMSVGDYEITWNNIGNDWATVFRESIGAAPTGHTHSSSDITNFNSSVSGLLPVKDIVAGSGISVSSTSGIYTIDANISGVILETIQDNLGSGFLVAGTGVQLTYNDVANTLRLDNLHTEINELSLEPQGFVNRLDSIISFNDSTRTFTIAPSGASYDIYIEGIKVTKTTSESIVIPTGTALNYLHFDTDTGLLSNKTTSFNFDTDVPIAYIHWNSDINQSTFFGEERHGIRMDSMTHKWIHYTFGMQYIDGLSIGGYTLLGNGSSNSHAQINISDGTLYQEDIIINITDGNNGIEFTQQLNPIAYVPVYYHFGSTGQWVRDISTPYPLKYNATRAQYNLYSGGTWTIPNVTNNRYFAMWIVATNDINDPVLAIMGQREDSSLISAENYNTWSDINLTNIPTNELRPLYRLIFLTNDTFTNTPKSSLQSILDLRKSIVTTIYGVSQNDHGSLFGLGDDDHLQYVHINEARTISANHTLTNGLTISSGLLSATSGSFTSLSVNSTGVSLNGHTHTSSNITDFNSSVSGLLPSVSGSGYATTSFTNNVYTVSVTGLQPSGNYSVVGHTHTSSNITDFNSSVSGLLPVTNITSGQNITVAQSGTIFNIAVTGSLGLTTEEVDDRVNNLLVGGTGIVLNYDDFNNTLTINGHAEEIVEYIVSSAFPASGDLNVLYIATDVSRLYKWTGYEYVEVGPSSAYVEDHNHTVSDITDFNSSVSGLLPSISGSGYINSSFVNNLYTISVSGLQPSGNYSVVGHTHTSSDITDFNSSISGLFPNNIVTGIGSSGYLTKWTGANSVSSGIVYDDGTNIGIGTSTPSGLLDVAGNLTFNTFTEKVITNTNSGSGVVLSIDSGTVHRVTLTDNCTFTMPSAVAGKSFSLFLNTGSGNYTASFSGVLWSDSASPTITTTANKVDILSFISDGSYWYGSYSQNYG
jgi:hypothetical protein